MDIDKIIAEVERLDREATPGPYAASPGSLSNWKVPGPQPDLLVEWAVNGFGDWTLAQQEIDTQAMAVCRNAAPLLAAEVKRLCAGGCARDQRTTQFCAEAVAKDAEIAKLRAEVARLKRALIEPTEETGDPDSEHGAPVCVLCGRDIDVSVPFSTGPASGPAGRILGDDESAHGECVDHARQAVA